MLMTILPLALGMLGAMQAATDTTFAVRADARLELRNAEGAIRVDAWDESRVRVRVEHGSRDRLRVENRGAVVSIGTERDRGRAVAVDYRITVPRGMALTVMGMEAYIEVVGVRGDVRAESVEGDIVARDIGMASLSTVEGDITVYGAASHLRASTTDGDLVLDDVQGNLEATTLDGDVLLTRIASAIVSVSTVDGEIRYDGVIRDDGRYRFTTHDGDVTLLVPSGVNATVTVATYDGDFESTFPVRVQPRGQHGHRFTFTLGNGSAQVELESFDGAIRLRSR